MPIERFRGPDGFRGLRDAKAAVVSKAVLLSFKTPTEWRQKYHSNAGIGAFLINTQLQLGEEKPAGPWNRFNGFADDVAQTVKTVRAHAARAPH